MPRARCSHGGRGEARRQELRSSGRSFAASEPGFSSLFFPRDMPASLTLESHAAHAQTMFPSSLSLTSGGWCGRGGGGGGSSGFGVAALTCQPSPGKAHQLQQEPGFDSSFLLPLLPCWVHNSSLQPATKPRHFAKFINSAWREILTMKKRTCPGKTRHMASLCTQSMFCRFLPFADLIQRLHYFF